MKPVDSAGSDGVKLCHSFAEAKEHFHHLKRTTMVNGGECTTVLCQEYLRGKEYVVDHVSRDGVHKSVMTWLYDKKPANGASFVYFGVVPVDSESPEAKAMIPYIRAVLDVLGVRNGPSHGEIIMTEDGPCLVEMNCRAHGGDGNWQSLCSALCGGYNQVDATVDCYLNKENFNRLPDKPPSPFKASGQEVDLVSFSEGTVKATPGFDLIRKLRSFVLLESHVKPGSKVSKTVDLVTDIGNIILMHPDGDVLKEDTAFIRKLEEDNKLFEFELEGKPPRTKLSEEQHDISLVLPEALSTYKNIRKLSTADEDENELLLITAH
uniref:ATP-grasp domain-containing protein n=1 Tax=Pseudictyota dubia TaxID=2749911 RepID=A0A7R9VNH8_9STRA